MTVISVGKYCAEKDCVIVLNSEGAYALPKGVGLAPIIQSMACGLPSVMMRREACIVALLCCLRLA